MVAKSDEKNTLPANDAWTGMLAVSLVALIAGCVLLFFDWRNYMEAPKKLQPPPITQQQDEDAAKEAPPPGADKKGAEDEKKGAPEKKG